MPLLITDPIYLQISDFVSIPAHHKQQLLLALIEGIKTLLAGM